jgi:hypothetical protein
MELKNLVRSTIKYLGPPLLLINLGAGYATALMLESGTSKEEIESMWREGIRYVETNEKIPIVNELIDFPTRPGRGLAYLLVKESSVPSEE